MWVWSCLLSKGNHVSEDKAMGSLQELKDNIELPRGDGRNFDDLRQVTFERHYLDHVPGSVLVSFGRTRVLCTVSVEDRVPRWLQGKGQGWLTAEYAMLPASTDRRKDRDISRGKLDGRSSEIQRLIGRSLRNVIDLKALGEKTVWVDCDVIQADGGTRTASITGAYVALEDAFKAIQNQNKKKFKSWPLTDSLSAISVGIVKGKPLLDLNYEEDSTADVDLNIVMNGSGRFVEVQGTGEGNSFSVEEFNQMIELGQKGCNDLKALQKEAIS
jgi:ribonuclease PH